jgi:hypothetical protein
LITRTSVNKCPFTAETQRPQKNAERKADKSNEKERNKGEEMEKKEESTLPHLSLSAFSLRSLRLGGEWAYLQVTS